MRIFFSLMAMLMLSNIACAKGLVVSIHPLFLIAQEVTKGVEQPTLLLSPQQSGHDAQLTPRNRQEIRDADLVIWLGKQHEATLATVLSGQKNAVSILDTHFLQTLPLRDVNGKAIPNSIDSHVWLEPNNAVRIAFFIAALRSQQIPENKEKYFANARLFAKRMFDATHVQEHMPSTRYYWAYHDAYHYVERSLSLKFAGALTPMPDIAPTATQLSYLNQSRPQKNMCLIAEFDTNQGIIQKLMPVKVQALDEAMSTQNDFIKGWLNIANSIAQCLN